MRVGGDGLYRLVFVHIQKWHRSPSWVFIHTVAVEVSLSVLGAVQEAFGYISKNSGDLSQMGFGDVIFLLRPCPVEKKLTLRKFPKLMREISSAIAYHTWQLGA